MDRKIDKALDELYELYSYVERLGKRSKITEDRVDQFNEAMLLIYDGIARLCHIAETIRYEKDEG